MTRPAPIPDRRPAVPSRAGPSRRRLRSQVALALSVSMLLPAAILVGWGQLYVRGAEMAAQHGLYDATRAVRHSLDDYLEEHRSAVLALAEVLPGTALTAALDDRLARTRRLYPGFRAMLVADARGRIVAASPALDTGGTQVRGAFVGDRPYFQDAMAGRAEVSRVFESRRSHREPIVAVSAPLAGPGGAARGVVEGSLDLRRFQRVEQEHTLPQARVVIVDAAGTVVYGGGDRRYPVLGDLDTTALARGAAADTGQAVFEYRDERDGERYLAGVERSALGWRVYVTQPRDAVFHDVHVFHYGLISTILAAALVTVGLIWWLTARAMRPLERLVDALRDFSVIDPRRLDLPVPPDAPSEVVELVDGFEVMSDRVRGVMAGVVPICAACKKIRDAAGRWEAVETYVRARSKAEFTHTVCPDCATRLYGDGAEPAAP